MFIAAVNWIVILKVFESQFVLIAQIIYEKGDLLIEKIVEKLE